MGLTAIECPDGVCHSHHGGHAVDRATMKRNLQVHGKEWCERLAERIYEMSVDTFSQTVMPSLHSSGWQRRHLNWEFKLDKEQSEPDETLVEGIINATESFLRSSEVHRLFIQELVQGTFAEATEDNLRATAVRKLVEDNLLIILQNQKEELISKITKELLEGTNSSKELAHNAASEGLDEVQRLLMNHTEAMC
ncbi:EF-1 guanine nucleotide exchange domain-containing protein [Prochlorococcus sp. MIT 1300]|uniref:EF-1 guanine nucleotide exchange domain-containing protein n=1 Tax=Prochlorococcus sp. MIT 1300 TaxID=3096218 RepID=UPI002A7605DF|nr:EF-1 guanine nucleotide exchange domain-containing protein [Prochlorococcus sp. MIT 1300]